MEGQSFERTLEASSYDNAPNTEPGDFQVSQERPAHPAEHLTTLNPEERLEELQNKTQIGQQEISRLTQQVESTKAQLNKLREAMGLPPTEEDVPSTASELEKLQELQAEQEALVREREQLLRDERERLIREAKQNILQEKIDALFEEFGALDVPDLDSLFQTGRSRRAESWQSSAMGPLDPEVVKSLVRAFKEGVKLLPKILATLPDLLKQFDQQLSKAAEERVDEKLEQELKEEKQEEKMVESTEPISEENPQPSEEPSPQNSANDMNDNELSR